MKLFEDTLLFNEGKKRFTDFGLPDAELKLWEQFIPKEKADEYYQSLLENSP